MKYVHSLLAIRHYQLKVNRKFNVNFNLNMKYDSVRGKQKTILISQHHWSTTASHPHDQTALTLLLPPSAYPHLYAFCPHCFWKFKKNWKEEGDDMHHKHVFSEIHNGKWFLHRGPQRLCT